MIERVLPNRPSESPRSRPSRFPRSCSIQAALRSACDDDAELLGKLCRIFRAKTPDSLDRVRAAIRDEDPAQLREAAHHLRGLLSTFSTTAAQATLDLEAIGMSGQLEAAPPILESLAEMIRRLDLRLDDLSIEQLRREAEETGEDPRSLNNLASQDHPIMGRGEIGERAMEVCASTSRSAERIRIEHGGQNPRSQVQLLTGRLVGPFDGVNHLEQRDRLSGPGQAVSPQRPACSAPGSPP